MSKNKVIVTLTTIPSRLKNINQTIDSIKNQTYKPDEIVLTLPLESIREPCDCDPYDINEINKIKDVTILRCDKDYGPATKLLGVLEREKDKNLDFENESLIITLDDDKKYDKECVKQLIDGWKRNKSYVVARKGSKIIKLKKTNKIYQNNKSRYDKLEGQHEILLVGKSLSEDTLCSMIFGTGGILYRPSFFDYDIFNYKEHNKDFPDKEMFYTDDIFFSGYLAKKGIKKKIIKFDETEMTKKIDKLFKFKNNTGVIDDHSENRVINPLINYNKTKLIDSHKCVKYFEKYLISITPE